MGCPCETSSLLCESRRCDCRCNRRCVCETTKFQNCISTQCDCRCNRERKADKKPIDFGYEGGLGFDDFG